MQFVFRGRLHHGQFHQNREFLLAGLLESGEAQRDERVCGFLYLRAELFRLGFIFRLWQGHNHCEPLVKRLLLTEQSEDPFAGASRCFRHLFPKTRMLLTGLALARAIKTGEEFANPRHHFCVVSRILCLQFQNLVHQPVKKRGFFYRYAGRHRATRRSGGESIG